MTSKELVLETMKKYGITIAQDLQTDSDTMTGTEIIANDGFIPMFSTDTNILGRPAGYLCQTEAGNTCKLLTPYDSDIYTGQPEEYPPMWGFKYSTDPDKAKDFLALSTSPYMVGDCAIGLDGVTYRSTIDNNVWEPSENTQYWEGV